MKHIIILVTMFIVLLYGFSVKAMQIQTSTFNPVQVVSSTVSNANYTTTAGHYGDLTSISLSPGKWMIFINVTWLSNGATTTAYVNSGVSTTSGNNSTGLTIGQTYVTDQKDNATDTRTSQQLVIYVTPLTTTTYYLKALAATSTTNLQRSASMLAWQVTQ